MRIAITGECLAKPSGFSQQLKLLAEGLHRKGHEVHVLGAGRDPEFEDTSLTQWSIDYMDPKVLDRVAGQIRPDAMILFGFMGMVTQLAMCRTVPMNCPMFCWVPWESCERAEDVDNALRLIPEEYVVHVSKFSRDLFDYGSVIPHMVDLSVFKSKRLSSAIRQKWSKRCGTYVIPKAFRFLNVDRNDTRKRWDLTFDFLRRLRDKVRVPVQMFAHAKIGGKDAGGYDLAELASKYGVEDLVIFTPDKPCSVDDLVELYQLCHFRVSTSMGEGFGIPTIEAMATGCVNVCPANTAFTEILGNEAVPCSGTEYSRSLMWDIPDVAAMVEYAAELCENPGRRSVIAARLSDEVAWYSQDRVVTAWEKKLQEATENYRGVYKHRWGFLAKRIREAERSLIASMLEFWDNPRMVHVQAFDGDLVDFCLRMGRDAVGIEGDKEALSHASVQARKSIVYDPKFEKWPRGEVCVILDTFDLFAPNALPGILQKVSKFPWSFLRIGASGLWHGGSIDPAAIRTSLEELGMVRRFDLEEIVAKSMKIDKLELEIWQNHPDTTVMPKGLMKSART